MKFKNKWQRKSRSFKWEKFEYFHPGAKPRQREINFSKCNAKIKKSKRQVDI